MSLNPPELWRTSEKRRLIFDRLYLEKHHPWWFEQILLAEKKKAEELEKECEMRAQQQSELVFPSVAMFGINQKA